MDDSAMVFGNSTTVRPQVSYCSICGWFRFFQKGFVMMRFFGLVLVVASMVQSADAALLSAWRFEGSTAGSTPPGAPQTAGAFATNGDVGIASHGIPGNLATVSGNGVWRTGGSLFNGTDAYSATRFNSFSYTAAKADTDFTELKFRGKRNNGNSGTPTVFVNARYSIDGGPEVTLGTLNLTQLTMTPFQLNAPISLAAGKVIDFRFYYARQGNATQADLDDIELFGDSQNVPEPASLAIFGLLGTGVALRRMRRKS